MARKNFFFLRGKKALNFLVIGGKRSGLPEHMSALLCVILRWDQFAVSPSECTTY